MKIATYILCLMAAIAAPVYGQDLTKEITVEKDIVPQEREASRIDRLPGLQLPAVDVKKLSWSDRAVAAPVTATISTLAPSGYMSTMERSPWRGYVDAGYFPALQAALSAGYRFVDNESMTAGAWLQYDGSQYKRENIVGNKLQYRDNSARVGADMTNRFDGVGTLTGTISYAYSAFNYPTLIDKGLSQNANDIGLNLGWSSLPGKLGYHAMLGYNFFKFGKPDFEGDKALSENYLTLDLGIDCQLGDSNNSLGADVNFGFMGDNGFYLPETDTDKSSGLLDITPYFLSKGDTYRIKLGLVVGHTFNRGATTYVAPDVKLEWMPASKFAVMLAVDGGAALNPVATMFASDHMINPSQVYGATRRKIGVDGGFIIGPFAGASFKVWGGYADYTNQLMPELMDTADGNLSLVNGSYDFKSINYGVMFSYRYSDIASFYVSYEGAPQDFDRGYSCWRDRAKSVLKAGVTVTPVSKLDLSLGYQLRSGRRVYELSDSPTGPFDQVYSWEALGKVSSLDFGAAFRINNWFSVWARGENLLNSKWQERYLLPCKGVTGLIGLGFKF